MGRGHVRHLVRHQDTCKSTLDSLRHLVSHRDNCMSTLNSVKHLVRHRDNCISTFYSVRHLRRLQNTCKYTSDLMRQREIFEMCLQIDHQQISTCFLKLKRTETVSFDHQQNPKYVLKSSTKVNTCPHIIKRIQKMSSHHQNKFNICPHIIKMNSTGVLRSSKEI
jgi:hypothetical protein